MLIRLAVWYLEKRNVSVLLNWKLENGTAQMKRSRIFMYSNDVENVEFKDLNGDKVHFIPPGKFRLRYQLK